MTDAGPGMCGNCEQFVAARTKMTYRERTVSLCGKCRVGLISGKKPRKEVFG